jgi:hypothetical protein
MKDCGYTLRKAYIDKLASASYSLGVYDTIAPDTVEPPFMIISSQTQAENSNKQSFGFDVTIQFDIVYRTFKAGEVGQKTVDTYTNEFLNIVYGRDINYNGENEQIDELGFDTNNNMINNKKRKLTNIEREIPKVLKLLNNEITRTNNINELLNSCEDEFNDVIRKKLKKVLLGSKVNNKKINKHVQSINRKIYEIKLFLYQIKIKYVLIINSYS